MDTTLDGVDRRAGHFVKRGGDIVGLGGLRF